MQFTASKHSTPEEIWQLILITLEEAIRNEVSSASSSFYKTEDGLECTIRKKNGDVIGTCYSESDRMGNRRWTIILN